MPRAKLVRAKASFQCSAGGKEYFVRVGEVFPASSPVAKAAPELFEPEHPVEQATAAPGERR
jgi:hypothetical protein